MIVFLEFVIKELLRCNSVHTLLMILFIPTEKERQRSREKEPAKQAVLAS